jgi:hypothetical protein
MRIRPNRRTAFHIGLAINTAHLAVLRLAPARWHGWTCRSSLPAACGSGQRSGVEEISEVLQP